MKATGIVRRIDDLGRIVIPKEIRRTMRIREGDPLEIFVGGDEIVFKKYSLIGELTEFAAAYADTLHESLGLPVAICDTEHVVAAGGIPKKEIEEKHNAKELSKLMEDRASFLSGQGSDLQPIEGYMKNALAIFPIISSGDILGAVIAFQGPATKVPTETETKLVKLAANFMSKHTESI